MVVPYCVNTIKPTGSTINSRRDHNLCEAVLAHSLLFSALKAKDEPMPIARSKHLHLLDEPYVRRWFNYE